MKLNYKQSTYILIIVTAVLALSLPITFNVLAGNIDSSAAPNATNSYTLADIYNRLNAGTAGSQNAFTEPATGPGSTMADLNSIMGVAPALDAANGAGAADVTSSKTFWGLTSGQWGVITGTGVLTLPYAAPVPKTGQTTAFATGDDGDLERGVAWPNPRFTDNSDGTVTDNLTGLIWLKNANCFGLRDWSPALLDANSLASASCGLSDGSVAGDWRLPNLGEMQSLVHDGFSFPALPNTAGTGKWTAGDPFTNVQMSVFDEYWTSTTSADNTNSAWQILLTFGFVNGGGKASGRYVWPVRGGQ